MEVTQDDDKIGWRQLGRKEEAELYAQDLCESVGVSRKTLDDCNKDRRGCWSFSEGRETTYDCIFGAIDPAMMKIISTCGFFRFVN